MKEENWLLFQVLCIRVNYKPQPAPLVSTVADILVVAADVVVSRTTVSTLHVVVLVVVVEVQHNQHVGCQA